MKYPKVVVIGGGTGSFTLLQGLKKLTPNLTALVNMSDDGGSTGILRDELGVLPPGDVRQCLVALSDSSSLRDLFNYRFSEGSLKGHSFGNLFLSAFEKMTDDFEKSIKLASEVLHITGQVIPITTDKAKLVLEQQDGEIVKGEFKIGKLHFLGKTCPKIYHEPAANLTEAGRKAILEADIIVIAPGNLYGSLAPALTVSGIADSLQKTKAKIAYVCNLVTKPNQTDGFGVANYAAEIERFVGKPVLDYVIYNTDEPADRLLDRYTHDGEKIVQFDLNELSKMHYTAVGRPLIAKTPITHDAGDKIAAERSLIRHDSDVLARELINLV